MNDDQDANNENQSQSNDQTTNDENQNTQDTNFNNSDNASGDIQPMSDDNQNNDANQTDTNFNGTGTNPNNTVQAAQNNEKKKPGLEYDTTRKYNLFREYMSLYNAIDNYISKLDTNIKDDLAVNQLVKTAVSKLREVKDLTYDYMMIKFETNTYIQSLLFYQNLVVSVQLIFKLLTKTKKINK